MNAALALKPRLEWGPELHVVTPAPVQRYDVGTWLHLRFSGFRLPYQIVGCILQRGEMVYVLEGEVGSLLRVSQASLEALVQVELPPNPEVLIRRLLARNPRYAAHTRRANLLAMLSRRLAAAIQFNDVALFREIRSMLSGVGLENNIVWEDVRDEAVRRLGHERLPARALGGL